MWVGIEEIQCFQTVMEEGSINAASQKLNKAKSAVSYSINKLEDQLGFMLFKRGKYRLEPTRKGQEFADRSKSLIEEAHRLEAFADQMKSGVELTLSMSCTELYPLNEVAKVLRSVSKKFPTTEIRFQREIMSGEKLLNQGVVDLAIYEELFKKETYEYKEIKTTQMKLMLSAKHQFLELSRKDQSFENLCDYPQIVQRSTLPSEIKAGIFEDSTKWFVNDINTKKELILEGLGWGRLPDHQIDKLIEKGKLVHLKSLESSENVKLYLVRRKKENHGKVNQFIWEQF